MLRKNGPGGCCCDCDCVLSPDFDDWIETAGDWTIVAPANYEATTPDSDAELTCNVTEAGWKVATANLRQRKYGEWVQFGFRDASGDNRLYIRWKVTKPGAPYVHTVEIIEVDGGTESTLSTTTWNDTFSGIFSHFRIWHDPDNDLFEFAIAFGSPVRASSAVDVDRPFVATETITGVVDFEKPTPAESMYVLFRKCLLRLYDLNGGPTYHIARTPAEFEVTISGVTAGSGADGASYAVFNNTFVLAAGAYSLLSGTGVDPIYAFELGHADYGAISFAFYPRYDYAAKKLKATFWISIQQADYPSTSNKQCVRFAIELDGGCSYDWRGFTDDLNYVSSRCWYGSGTGCNMADSVPPSGGFGAGGCDLAANFSAATISISPVP